MTSTTSTPAEPAVASLAGASEAQPLWPGWLHALVLALFSVSSLLATGYGFASHDASNYMPLTWIRLDPGLFPGDTVFSWIRESSWARHAAFFSVTTAALARLAPLEWVIFILHGLCLWGLFGAWWRIGRAIGGPKVGYLAVLLLSLSRPIGGTLVMSVPHEFQPRVVGAMLAFWAIAAWVDGRRIHRAALLAGLATLFHPISALMAMPVLALAPWLTSRPWQARLRGMLGVLALMIGPLVLWRLFNVSGALTDTGMLSLVSAEWQAIMDYRLQGQAVNALSWRAEQWLAVGLPVGFWLMALRERQPTPTDTWLGLACLGAMALAAIGIVATDVFRSSMTSQLMLSRLLFLPVVVGTAYGAWWLHHRWRLGGFWERFWGVGVGAALALGAAEQAICALVPLLALSAAGTSRELRCGVLGFSWVGLGVFVAVAVADRWLQVPAGVAQPTFGVFHQPAALKVLGLACLAGMVLAVSSLAGRWRTPLRLGGAIAAPVLVLLASLGPSHLPRAIAEHVQVPWHPAASEFADVAYWVRSNTPVEARFLAPFWEPGFRAMARRGIVTDWKDGGLTLFSEDLARRWMEVQSTVSTYAAQPEAKILELARRYRCDHVIMPLERRLALPVVYENGRYVVHRVTAP